MSDSVGASGAHMYVLITFPGDAATAGPWTTLKIMFLKKKRKSWSKQNIDSESFSSPVKLHFSELSSCQRGLRVEGGRVREFRMDIFILCYV